MAHCSRKSDINQKSIKEKCVTVRALAMKLEAGRWRQKRDDEVAEKIKVKGLKLSLRQKETFESVCVS